jgi:hypothetical protein
MPDVAILQSIEADFLAKHQEYRQILNSTPLALSDAPDTNTSASIIAEGTFIRYFTLWENSIERSFIYFCEGGVTLNGVQPVCRLANCSATEIRKILTNGLRYLDWSSQKTIRERANLFFENGSPFYGPVVGKSAVLSDIEKLRNMIAHASIESANGYKEVQRNNFKTERNFEMAPGHLLRVLARQTKKNWGEFYFDEFEAAFAAVMRP